MRADQLYRFSGDKVRIWRVILRGKMASLYQYLERLRQWAANCSASKEDVLTQGGAQMVAMSESEDILGQDPEDGDRRWAKREYKRCFHRHEFLKVFLDISVAVFLLTLLIEMSSNGFFVTWTVAQAIIIPPLLYVVCKSFWSAEVNHNGYCSSPLGRWLMCGTSSVLSRTLFDCPSRPLCAHQTICLSDVCLSWRSMFWCILSTLWVSIFIRGEPLRRLTGFEMFLKMLWSRTCSFMMFHHEYTINLQEIPSQSSQISTPQVMKGMLKFMTLLTGQVLPWCLPC
jgi:hypothetical protein